ncbi:hypothetical protein ACFGVS_20595 [Mucilaginibacter sp. AW1-7]|jgi:hypothetical protein|uniref:hypothetical protein n=1 Tax=Mucilaginibacter sp. AW1-7 TaxID=3349874 RepID=UPI003F736ABD
MKLLIVTCLKDNLDDVSKIFKQANIDIFSTTDIIGYRERKNTNLLEDWFASGGEAVNSMMVFTFTTVASADLGIKLIKDYNKNHNNGFPVRAFILPVEKSV